MNTTAEMKRNPSPNPTQIRVTLPQDVLDVVNEICCCQKKPCQCPACEIYLVGSSVQDIINNTVAHDKKDFDFLMITTSPQWLKTASFSNFIEHDRIPNLYFRNTKQFGGVPADLMIKSGSLYDNAQTRDLTICAIFLRVNGHPNELGLVYDPTGYGLSDLKSKQLYTIDYPSRCFQRDPICVLRTIKYLIRDYTPASPVIDALRQWNDPLCFENDHFISVLTRQLESPDYVEFIEQMKTYGMVSKMSWAQARDDEAHDIICTKFLIKLYLRYYQRTVLNYSYNLPAPITSDFSLENDLSLVCQYGDIATQRRFQAQKYFDQLHTKLIETTTKATLQDNKIAHCEASLAALSSQIEAQKNLFFRKKNLIDALNKPNAIQLNTNIELQNEIRTVNTAIEQQVNVAVNKNKRMLDAKKTTSQQLLQKDQQALSEAHEKNSQQHATLTSLRATCDSTKQKIQENNIRLQQLNEEMENLRVEVGEHNLHSAKKNTAFPANVVSHAQRDKEYPLSISGQNTNTTDVPKQRQKQTEKTDPSTTMVEPLCLSAVEDMLSKLAPVRLKSLFYKTILPDFKAAIAIQLALISKQNEAYVDALNYFYTALEILPKNKKIQSEILAIKLECPNVNWAEMDAAQWCAKGALAKKENKFDEAMLYYTWAIQCDTNYVNAYVGRMNIFYQQNHWLAFIHDYEKLLLIITTIRKTANTETQNSLKKLMSVLIKKIESAVNKQILMQQESEPSAAGLNAAWERSITTRLANIHSYEVEHELGMCYIKIIAEDPQKSIEYGMAHFELARNYYSQNKLESSVIHYQEALCVIPSFSGLLKELEHIEPVSVLTNISTAQQYVDLGKRYQQRYCYHVAFAIFDTAINLFPNYIPAYWALINCCFTIKKPSWIKEEVFDAVIELYLAGSQYKMSPVGYLRPLIELYIYKSQYQFARAALTVLTQYSYDKSILFCKNLNQTLSLLSWATITAPLEVGLGHD